MNKVIYCDFDGTISKKDSINTFFELYADEKWLEYEQLWVDGKISSRENAIKQVGLLPEMESETLQNYINSIEIDEYFIEFVSFLKSKGIKLVILSDGFDLFIKETLKKYNIDDIKFYANHLIYKNKKFSIEFPYYNEKCNKKSGMCKCSKIAEEDFTYIGDGTSDLCVAQKAKKLYATKVLLKHCKANNIKHVAFNSFRDIIMDIKGVKNGNIGENSNSV